MKSIAKWITTGALAITLCSSCLAAKFTEEKNVNVDWNIPLSLLGYFSGSVNFKVTPHMTIGPIAGIEAWSSNNTSNSNNIWSLGGQVYYALGGEDVMGDHIWLLNPYVEYMHVNDVGGASGGLLFMYQWAWNTGMNMQLGVGPAYTRYTATDGEEHSGGVFTPAFAFNLGFDF